MIPRMQAFEFCDQPWLPQILRDVFNDIIGLVHQLYVPYCRAAKHMSVWTQRSGATCLLDLGSAGGHHIASVLRNARKQRYTLPQIILSDLFPAPETWSSFQREFGNDAIGINETPLSAFNVPTNAPRHWTLFTAMHHFSPDQAREFLRHFTERADAICIAEFYHRSWYDVVMTVLAFVPCMLAPLFARKPTLKKILWNTIIPVGPVMATWDGIVSILRTYKPHEIIAMLPSDSRDQFLVETKSLWYGLVPMKSTLVFITRKSVLVG